MRSLPPEWVIGDGSERVRAVKGDSHLGAVRFQKSIVEKNSRTGEEYEGGMSLWRVSVAELYPDFVERLFAPPGKDGSWHVTSDCVNLGKSYLQQVCNLERRIKVNPSTGARKIEWGPRNHQIPVDFCDCEIYAEFAAEMVVGDLGWSREAWERWRQSRQRKQAGNSTRTERAEHHEDLSDR
jgi:phage terminase large subunit GpA-like protein